MSDMEMPDFVPYMKPAQAEDVVGELVQFYLGDSYEIVEKMAGVDFTLFVRDGVVGVGVEGAIWPVGASNPVCEWLRSLGFDKSLVAFESHVGKPFVIEGVMVGELAPVNHYDFYDTGFFVYNILDLEDRRQLTRQERQWFMDTFNQNPQVFSKLLNVPSTVDEVPFAPAARLVEARMLAPSQAEVEMMVELKAMAPGMSSVVPSVDRVGLVFRSMSHNFVFEVKGD